MVELRVENKLLDLFPNEVISFNISINDISSIESREGSYSNKFKVPSTSSNKSVFGYADVLNFVSEFRPTKSRQASVLVNGLEVQRGFIQIEQYNEKDCYFSVSFFSGNSEWIDLISDKHLGDLDLSDLNHAYTLANIESSFTNEEGYIYPFINYGRFNPKTSNNTDLYDWKPAVFSKTLLKRCFSSIGFKLKGDLLSDPIFSKHILPFSLENESIGSDEIGNLGFGAGHTTFITTPSGDPIAYDTVNEGNGYGNYDPLTGIYTANKTFEATIQANAIGCSPVSTVRMYVNGAIEDSAQSNSGQNLEYKTILNSGDTVYIARNKNATNSLILLSISQFSITPTDSVVEGADHIMSNTLPDIKQTEFIKDVFNQFGVIFTVDSVSKTVYVNKFESIKNNIVNAVDWTDKLDRSKGVEVDYTEIVSDYGRVNILNYSSNDDVEKGAAFGNLLVKEIGKGQINIDNDFLSKENDLFESVFTGSNNMPCFDGRVTIMYIPRYSSGSVDISSPDLDPGARCALNSGLVSVSDLFNGVETSIDIEGDSSSINVSDVPFCYFHIGATGIDLIDDIGQGLSFGDPYFPKLQKNLIDSYYPDYIKILNTPRKITLYPLLNERDLNNIDFLKPIYIGGEVNSYFILNEISDYRPNSSGVTKVELVLIS